MYDLSLYDFDLPESFIAQTPLQTREDSQLMILDKKNPKDLKHTQVKDLLSVLTPNDVLVMNSSAVIPARIRGDFGEIFLSTDKEEEGPEKNVWECLVKPGRKFKEGRIIDLAEGLKAEVIQVNENGTRNIAFSLKQEDFLLWLKKNGEIPQPPYIKEKIEDPKRYQTTFSKTGKSVAAATAGLHFSTKLLSDIKNKGIEIYNIHLDTGLGTFLPVHTKDIRDHNIHSEFFTLSEKTANALNDAKKQNKRIIAVGTTSIRVLETCSNKKGLLRAQSGKTNIFIYPGYTFKFIDAIFTNFHTPFSSLLMLVSSFAGRENILYAYEEAKKKNYRFFSFGDAMLIT
jgi:S-adenosylmethionine:tRNA ribosyltransferase-isomerase